MTMFQKPQPRKAALKVGLYGPAGSGKTFTSLLIAEGMARHAGNRVAVVAICFRLRLGDIKVIAPTGQF